MNVMRWSRWETNDEIANCVVVAVQCLWHILFIRWLFHRDSKTTFIFLFANRDREKVKKIWYERHIQPPLPTRTRSWSIPYQQSNNWWAQVNRDHHSYFDSTAITRVFGCINVDANTHTNTHAHINRLVHLPWKW